MIYHTTDKSRVESIMNKGLLPDCPFFMTCEDIEGIKEIFGMYPLFFATTLNYPMILRALPNLPKSSVMLGIDDKAFDKEYIYPDLPSLASETGMYYDYNWGIDYDDIRFYWENRDGSPEAFRYRDSISLNELKEQIDECIALTQSFAYLKSVSPEFIKII